MNECQPSQKIQEPQSYSVIWGGDRNVGIDPGPIKVYDPIGFSNQEPRAAKIIQVDFARKPRTICL